MRIPLLAVLILGLSGCDGGSAGPEAPAIVVRVSDDIGAPVGRIHVIITLAPSDRIDARTRGDGTVRVPVPEAGAYEVRVIPRAGHLGVPGTTSRIVTVGSGGTAVVDFTMHREGLPPRPGPGDESPRDPGENWPVWPPGPGSP